MTWKSISHKQPRNEDSLGMSLVELLVAMLLFSVLLAMVGSLFWSMTQSAAQARAINASSRTSSNAINELALVIRNGATVPTIGTTTPAPAFTSATSESMELHSVVSGAGSSLAPVRVSFTVNASRQLIEVRKTAVESGGYWTWPTSAPTTTRNLSGALVVSTDGSPLFSYLDGQGKVIAPVSTLGAISPADLPNVAAVAIVLRVQAEGVDKGRTIELKNTVSVPNLGNMKVS